MSLQDPSPSLTRFKRLAHAAQLFIAAVFAIFLIILGGKLTGDVDALFPPVDTRTIEQATRDEHLAAKLTVEERKLDSVREAREQVSASLRASERALQSLGESYGAWLDARSTMGSARENPEVRARLAELERARVARDGWRDELDRVDASIRKQTEVIDAFRAARDEELRRVQQALEKAQQERELRVFLARLLVVGPLAAAAIALWVRKRRTTLWPLVWGFAMFSLHAFFVGLVPYLPDFGGYVRSAGGVVLSALAAVYTARQLKRMIDERTQVLAQSQDERARRIRPGDAVKSLLAHTCPGCETHYGKLAVDGEEARPGFCAVCGLRLFAPCAGCRGRIFIHLPHCPTCGARPAFSVDTGSAAPT